MTHFEPKTGELKTGGRLSRWDLPIILAVVTGLRIWRLEAKPLWVDELYTAFYSLGKNPADAPVGVLLPVDRYWALLELPADSNVWQAAQAVTTYSNHPPLFFMLMNRWLAWFGSSVWSLRSLPVLCGLVAVVGCFYLGRRVGGSKVGRLAAWLMAVSPYGIYLSQEARHYSLAVAISLFSLTQWLALLKGKPSPYRWLAWIALNSLGLYVHYFYGFGILAQWLVTLGWLWQHRAAAAPKPPWPRWLLAMGLTALLYGPWLSTALTHFQSEGGTGWLSRSLPGWQTVLLPWVQSLVAGVFMLIMLPVEQVPQWVSIPAGLIMLSVFGVVLRQLIMGWRSAPLPPYAWPLMGYGLGVLAIMLAITYGLGKDLTVAPRYFFILYPAITVIVALGLARRRKWVLGVAIAAGLISQLLVSYDIALLKPYLPGQIGRRLGANPQSTLVIMASPQPSYQTRVLSYILAIPSPTNVLVGLSPPAPPAPWQPVLENLETLPNSSLTLWLVEPKRQVPFPPTIRLPAQTCLPVGKRINTEGTRQQEYQCKP
ncbi:MAG: glycosyltransferase family 39 protein [Cyanobacteria bacterium J06635_1]